MPLMVLAWYSKLWALSLSMWSCRLAANVGLGGAMCSNLTFRNNLIPLLSLHFNCENCRNGCLMHVKLISWPTPGLIRG